MKLIDRFVSRELVVNVLFAIAVLSLVLVVGNIFRKLLPLLVNHDVPMEYLITFIAYVLPFSLIFTIPWGLLTAILLVFGRLSADNELVALRSNGVSVTRVCIPLAGIGLLCTGLCLWLNVQVAPAAQERLRSTIFDLATRNPMALCGRDVAYQSGGALREREKASESLCVIDRATAGATQEREPTGAQRQPHRNQQTIFIPIRVYCICDHWCPTRRHGTSPRDVDWFRHGIDRCRHV